LLAGINAALQVQGREPWYPKRDQAYLGVLVDDLITRGTSEPYRMFTSRAEYRLLLREDNADLRLTEIAYQLGIVDEPRWQRFAEKREAIEKEAQRLERTCLRPGDVSAELAQKILGQPLSREYKLVDLLRRPEVSYDDLQQLDPTPVDIDPEVAQQVEVQTKYAGYIVRQQEEIDRHRRFEDTVLPEGIDYDKIYGLSTEIRQKLNDHRPATLGQAARISGVTPAAISLLLVHLKRRA